MNTMKAALVGTGFMGWVHADALRRLGVEVVGVCGSSPEKSRASAEQLGVGQAYSNYEQLLADDSVQCVHILTPNRLHFEMVQQAFAAGKHVMCEKPLAMNPQESAELVRLAADYPSLAAGVNYNIRYYPLCLEAREKTLGRSIGDVVYATGSYVQDWLSKPTDYNWRVLTEEVGELRAVADIGTHWLDLVQFITGKRIESVCADLLTAHPVRQRPVGEVQTFQSGEAQQTEPIEVATDDYGAILFHFEDGTRGCLHVSQITPGRRNCVRFEIAGSEETLAWNSESPNELWIGRRDEPNGSLLRDPSFLSGAALQAADYPGGHNEGYPDSFKACFRAFYSYIEAGDFQATPPFPTFEEAHHELVLCEAIAQSHRERRWVSTGEIK
ncbi:MAG: Gfo/Idh/MocA family oxidoreductase [Planctomycetota bacterium]